MKPRAEAVRNASFNAVQRGLMYFSCGGASPIEAGRGWKLDPESAGPKYRTPSLLREPPPDLAATAAFAAAAAARLSALRGWQEELDR